MKDIRKLHIEAMELAKIADEYLLSHQEALFVKFTSDAFTLENEAAQALIDQLDAEPTRGVLCRGAATLAYNIGLFQEAKKIIKMGLSGKQCDAIRLELEELQTKVETAIKANYSTEKVINDLKAILSNSSTIKVKSEAVERRKHAYRIGIMKAAAAVLVLIISGILCFHYGPSMFNGKNGILASYLGNRQDSTILTRVVPRGQEDSVSLPDGSIIYINADSHIEVQFSKDKRKVNFKGEAYFNVAPGRRPFIITTPYTTIEVLGTAFNVNTYVPEVTRISLVKGKVRFKVLDKDLIVRAGEELVYGPGGAIQLEPSRWQRGIYPVRGESLRSIATMLESVFDTCIVIDDRRLRNSHFVGAIDKSTGLMRNIKNIQKVIEFDHHFSDDTLHIAFK